MDRDVRSQLPHCFSVGNWACGAPGRPGNRLSKRRYSDNSFYTSCVRIEAFMVNFPVQSFHDLIVRSVSILVVADYSLLPSFRISFQ